MVKRFLVIVLTVLIVSSMVICGCAAPAPATPAKPSPTPTPAPTPTKALELKFTTTVPDVSGLGRGQKAWIEKVEKESGGKVKIIPYWANSLFKPREIFRGALDGQADFCYWVPNIELGLMPMNTFVWLPFMGWPSEWAQTAIYPQLIEKYPQLKAEYQGLMIYGMSSITPGHISTLKQEVRVPADLKGMKITPATEESAAMVMAAGGTPVNLVVSDWYSSAEKGVTTGFLNAFGALMAFRVLELTKFHAIARPSGFGMNPHFLLINPDNWKKIPADIQKVIKDNEAFYTEQCIIGVQMEEKMALEYADKNSHTTVNLTPAEWKQWADLAQPVHDAWLSKNAAKGAKEIYDTAKKMISEYKGK